MKRESACSLEGSQFLRQPVLGVFFPTGPCGFTPKHRNPKPDRLEPDFLKMFQVFWFLFWFERWFDPNSDDMTKPIEKAVYPKFI